MTTTITILKSAPLVRKEIVFETDIAVEIASVDLRLIDRDGGIGADLEFLPVDQGALEWLRRLGLPTRTHEILRLDFAGAQLYIFAENIDFLSTADGYAVRLTGCLTSERVLAGHRTDHIRRVPGDG